MSVRTVGPVLALAAAIGCAPVAAHRGSAAAGANTQFSSDLPAGASARDGRPWTITGADRDAHHLGVLRVPAGADSVVVIVYGDNRPGYRTRAQALGWTQIRDFDTARPSTWIPAAIGVPLAVVQLVVPTLDGFQDLATAWGTHRPNGGREAQVIEAIHAQPGADLAINTGDVVFDGTRAKLWDDFARKHEALRRDVAFAAAPGNHEHLDAPEGRSGWDAVVGPPARPERYWYTLDLPNQLARFVILDSNVLTDEKKVYPDDAEAAVSDEQLAWLDRALASPARHRFVVLHHPLLSTGSHEASWGREPGDAAWRRRERMEEAFARHGVDAVFAGHEHLYHRVFIGGAGGKGFWHVISGGGGSPLYAERKSTLDENLARPMAGGLHADAASSRLEVIYHFCRLVLPTDGGTPRLDVYRVHAGGGSSHVESLELAQPMP
jgi:hypothetical protein